MYFENEDIEKLKEFGLKTYRLMYLIRYNIYPRVNNEVVASHLSQVTLMSLYLCDLLKDRIEIDREKVLTMAAIHDIAESEGLDLVHNIRIEYPKLSNLVDEIELDLTEKMMGKHYAVLLKEFDEEKTLESIIVKIGDVLSCVIYAENEIKMGNKHFDRVLKESIARLDDLVTKLNIYLR